MASTNRGLAATAHNWKLIAGKFIEYFPAIQEKGGYHGKSPS
jgi:hypothetical protein